MSTETTILVTGGTGFLGKHLGRRLKADGNRVVLGARNNKQNFDAQSFSGCEVVPLDVTNIESMRDAVNRVRPNIIIHAAATKFVDLAERQPLECVDVNVLGSQNVARVAVDKGVDVVLGISTDKASPPVRNLYGLSKAVMERTFCYLNGKSKTKFANVRYGNVAWSTGSVLCIWSKMAKDKGVIGTTGPQMRRFFFTIDEAVELVTTALANIDRIQGKVLGREMKAAKIGDILEVWSARHGIKYETIEGRPGERMDEYLVGEQELPFTETAVLNGVRHWIVDFNEKAQKPLDHALSSENASPLTEAEIIQLIDNPPPRSDGVNRIQNAVILAAGRGTRMYPMTEVIPKPMAPFRGNTLISHGIAAMKRHGLRVHITVGYKRAALAQHVVELGVDSVINTEGQSNAWCLYHSLLSHLDEPLLVLTCDNITEISVERLAEDYLSLAEPACMVVPVKPIPGVDGDYIRHTNQAVTSLSRTEATEMYCSGIQVVNPTKLQRFAPAGGDFTAVWAQLMSQRQLMASTVYPHEWMSIDTIDALLLAEKQEPTSHAGKG